jgi:hypothetical protein
MDQSLEQQRADPGARQVQLHLPKDEEAQAKNCEVERSILPWWAPAVFVLGLGFAGVVLFVL